jgi:hypothetical protein
MKQEYNIDEYYFKYKNQYTNNDLVCYLNKLYFTRQKKWDMQLLDDHPLTGKPLICHTVYYTTLKNKSISLYKRHKNKEDELLNENQCFDLIQYIYMKNKDLIRNTLRYKLTNGLKISNEEQTEFITLDHIWLK